VDAILARLLKHSDLAAVLGVLLVVVMMIVPLPSGLLSVLITLNVAGALAIVTSTMYVKRALDFSAFPSLLLLTTLFRLAINVSVTRLVLTKGEAGSVIKAFGSFVVGGNLVVGLVVFMILVVIQFVVITAGAGRVAEVAARFTLDAMPGKQMAIDADLNAGQITEAQARERRLDIAREADFYGAMDGASKFVKGDAMAGVIIVSINLLGGILVGVVQHHISFGTAIHTYSLLTVGDGLAAQIPALLISTATGILVTRSATSGDLGTEITNQILGQPRVPMIAGSVIFVMGLIPGLPKIPFFLVGGVLVLVARAMRGRVAGAAGLAAIEDAEQATLAAASSSPVDAAVGALGVDPLELAIGFGLVPLVDKASGGALLARVGVVRRQIASEFGIVIAPVRIHDEMALEPHEYVIRVRGSEVARARSIPGHRLAMNPGDAVPGLAGIPTIEPAFGLPAVWIDDGAQAEAEALGYTVVDTESMIVTHLTETIRAHAAELLTRQEVKQLLDTLREQNAAAVEDVVPDKLGLGEVQRVLQQLLREGVSIRDLGAILESIGDRAAMTRDPATLVEAARQTLSRSITAGYLDQERTLHAITIDSGAEQEILESLAQTPDGERLAMEPSRAEELVGELVREVDKATSLGKRPVLLCSTRIRRHVRGLIEQAFPQLPVISYNEIAPGIRVEATGSIALANLVAA
jgi:flagellar biosynthesis protein FlhA